MSRNKTGFAAIPKHRRVAVAIAGLLLVTGGCGSAAKDAPTPVAAIAATPPPTTAPVTQPPPTIATTSTSTAPTTTSRSAQPSTTQAGRVIAGTVTVPNMVGQDLQLAQDSMQAAGLYVLRSHDATGAARFQVLDRAWKVCDQTPKGGSRVATDQLIDFGVVRDEERCP